jgi:hypothetical protein
MSTSRGVLESQRVGDCANQTSLMRYDLRPVEPRLSPIRILPLHVCQRAAGSLESQRVGNCANQTSLMRYDLRPVEPRLSPIRILPLHVCQRAAGSLESQRVGNCANQTSLLRYDLRPADCSVLATARGFLRVVRIQTNKFISNDHTGRWACNYMHPTRTPTALSYRTLYARLAHYRSTVPLCHRSTVPHC